MGELIGQSQLRWTLHCPGTRGRTRSSRSPAFLDTSIATGLCCERHPPTHLLPGEARPQPVRRHSGSLLPRASERVHSQTRHACDSKPPTRSARLEQPRSASALVPRRRVMQWPAAAAPWRNLLILILGPLLLLAFLFARPSRELPRHVHAPPRNVYLDLGANWAQTLDLYTRLQEKGGDGAEPWEVYSFEASPWIQWFVDQTVAAKNAGGTAPALPFPASGSTADLRRFGDEAGCNGKALRSNLLDCMLTRYRGELESIQPDKQLNDSTLLSSRLDQASTPYRPRGSEALVRYTFVPAAVTVSDGWMEIRQSMIQLLIGGVVTTGDSADWTKSRGGADTTFPVARVRTIDLVGWISRSFSERDNVVVKMDVEGAEHAILPELVRQGKDTVIKVLAMECHRRGKVGDCAALDKLLQGTKIKVLKEGRDYQGWTSDVAKRL